MRKMLTNIGLVVVIAAIAAYVLYQSMGKTSGEDAQRLVSEGARLIDVRTPQEFAAGHIEGARNIPLQELPSRLSELEPKADPIVVYCRSGNRSGQAKTLLGDEGFSKVYDLGAMSRWP